MNFHLRFRGNFQAFYFEWFYGGADFERHILPVCSRSDDLPLRSRSTWFFEPRSPLRSAQTPLTCSAPLKLGTEVAADWERFRSEWNNYEEIATDLDSAAEKKRPAAFDVVEKRRLVVESLASSWKKYAGSRLRRRRRSRNKKKEVDELSTKIRVIITYSNNAHRNSVCVIQNK